MLSKITSAPRKVKNHVVRHRAKYAAATTAVIALKLQMSTADKFNAFLEEKGLTAEYYATYEA